MRGYFHTDSDMVLSTLAEAITRADLNGQSFRINVENGVLTYKVGQGGWSPPIRSTPDAYRDSPLDWEDDEDWGNIVQPIRLPLPVTTWAPDGLSEVTTYSHTHASVRDNSPAMLVSSTLDSITLMNECGDVWTDPVEQWRPIN